MAFQTALLPVSLASRSSGESSRCVQLANMLRFPFQNLVAATAEAWPSVATTVLGSWRATSACREARPAQAQQKARVVRVTVSS